MRFTKIPLIATLMAVALSLLIVLPGLAQTSGYDDTRGKLSSGSSLTVEVEHATRTDSDANDNVDETIADSYFNGALYASNDDDAHNIVRIKATGGDRSLFNGPDGVKDDIDRDGDATNEVRNESDDNIYCAVATVKNNRSGKKISVRLSNATPTTADLADPPALEMVKFAVVANGLEEESNGSRVCGEQDGDTLTSQVEFNTATLTYDDVASTEAMGARMPARHGDTLTVTVAGVAGSVTLTVDAEGPEFSEISPAHGAKLRFQTVKFRFLVSDADSGIAHDGELDYSEGDNDPRAYNTDNDNFTTSEPRSMADDTTTTNVDENGASRDIKVFLNTVEKSADGNSNWKQRGDRPGVSYFLDMAVSGVGAGSNPWYLQATDRAGNTARTDADPGKDDDQDFSLIVDISSPEFRDARTGISYDPDKKKEIVDRSYIAVTFEDDRGPDAVQNIDADKFLVEDADVVGFIHLGDKSNCGTEAKPVDPKKQTPKDIDDVCIGPDRVPGSRIYLELAEPLAPDATPQVSMFGGAVLDLAGNSSNQDEVIAADNIAPAITVTLATDVSGRPVIRNNGEVTVSISSDEELRRLPTVYFGEVVDGADADAEEADTELASIRRGDRVQTGTGELTWSRTYRNGDVGGSDGLYAVIVVAEDDADNVGVPPGWEQPGRKTKAPVDGHGIDFDDLTGAGLALEIDTDANNDEDPGFSLSPQAAEGETESNNPYITIDFGKEAGEYSTSTKRFKSDSHSAMEIVSITLNGSDVMEHTAAVESNKYTLAAQDLAIGEYDLKVTGRDDVGNEVSDTYEFEVVARGAYKVNLTPGWNLVSLPGTPLDSSTQAVMGGTMQATIVLAYQDDAWLTSVNDNGTWRGTLTDIVGGYGYWVQTTAFESISALIPETDTSSVLPTAKVIAGWNLLGVVDVLQNKAGSVPSGGGEADDYFDNIAWKVAYSFDTSSNAWEKSIPKDGDNDDEIVNGKGYWVWSTEAGTLVP